MLPLLLITIVRFSGSNAGGGFAYASLDFRPDSQSMEIKDPTKCQFLPILSADMHVADRVLLQVTAKACEAMLNEWFDHYDVQPCDGYLTADETNRALNDWIAKVIFPFPQHFFSSSNHLCTP